MIRARHIKALEAFALMRGRELKYIDVIVTIKNVGSPSCEGGS